LNNRDQPFKTFRFFLGISGSRVTSCCAALFIGFWKICAATREAGEPCPLLLVRLQCHFIFSSFRKTPLQFAKKTSLAQGVPRSVCTLGANVQCVGAKPRTALFARRSLFFSLAAGWLGGLSSLAGYRAAS
jgi:hypothetical protein